MQGYSTQPIFKFALREDLKDDKRFLPTRAEPKATGYDVRAAFKDKKPLVLKPFDYAKIPLGVRGFCPDGWWYELKPRSSTFGKKNLHALYGTVDETYEGELLFACQYIPEFELSTSVEMDYRMYNPTPEYMVAETTILASDLTIDFGDAIGQIIPVERKEMIVVEVTNEDMDLEYSNRGAARGAGGFGSTGK